MISLLHGHGWKDQSSRRTLSTRVARTFSPFSEEVGLARSDSFGSVEPGRSYFDGICVAEGIKLEGQHILREWTDARERFRLHARKQIFPRLRVTADIGTLYGAARLVRAIRCVSMPDRAVE